MAPSMEATRVAVSRRAAILFCSISSAASRWMVRIVDTPKPTMSTTTIRSPIFSASGERNTAVASAARGLGDGLRQLVGLARIERQQARVHRTRVVETAHLDVRVTQVLERLRIVRPQPERLEIRLHRLVPVALLAQRVAEPVPGLGQLGIELDRLAVLALRGRPVAALGERASLVEARLGADGAPVGHAQRRVVDGVRHRRHRQPREPEHRPAHRGDGSIWRVNLARLGEESVERFGEYTALHFEGRDLTNVEQQRTAARVARALARMGVSPGDRVVVLLPNCPEVLAAYTGILKAGAVILYTSGTTGRPKGVALSHANLASNARAAASLYELDRERWSLGVLPLSHSYGLVTLNAGNILGTKSVLLRWFNPEAVLDAIARFRVQSMAGVPTMYVYLLNYPDADRFDTSSMRSWGSGAATLPSEIVEPFEKKFGGRLLEGYGLTEASPVVSTTRLSGVRKLGSVGQPIPGVEVTILDDEDRALPVGETGEIGVRGPNVMVGYYGLPEETARALRNGWLHTGDVGRLDAD